MPDLVMQIMGAGAWISPSHYLLAGVKLAIGLNPAEYAAKRFAGDWESVATLASAYRQLAEYFSALGAAVNDVNGGLADGWSGNAATSASTYFTNLALAVDALGPALTGLGDQFTSAAAGIQNAHSAVVSALEAIADWAIVAGIAAAGGTITAETGVGAVLGGAGAGVAVLRIVSLWNKVLSAIDNAILASQALVGAAAGWLSTLDGWTGSFSPGEYDHPRVSHDRNDVHTHGPKGHRGIRGPRPRPGRS